MNVETHSILDGKVQLYKRDESRFWQCSTYMDGKNHRISTQEEMLTMAKEFARDWYMTAYVISRQRNLNKRTARLFSSFGATETTTPPILSVQEEPQKQTSPTFKVAAEKFLAEYNVITEGQRSKDWTAQHEMRVKVHLMPFFGDKPLHEITAGLVQEYRIHRSTNGHKGRKPGRSTLHHETVTLRLVLKTAHRYGWITQVPDISPPYKTSGKVKHRGWFSPEEYQTLFEETRKRAENPVNKHGSDRYKYVWQDLHDYVLFMANTGLRPDEAARLEYRDVTEVKDQDSGERLLEIEVRGKRGVGYCKSMNGAIFPFQRMRERYKEKLPTDKIFGRTPRDELNKVLNHLNLKTDRDGNTRSAYSLRHTYICLRLMEGADIYQIAKNCRTSVEMIEKFYAAHLKNTLDAAAINVRKPKKKANKNKGQTKT